jgi:hypothetical protein
MKKPIYTGRLFRFCYQNLDLVGPFQGYEFALMTDRLQCRSPLRHTVTAMLLTNSQIDC